MRRTRERTIDQDLSSAELSAVDGGLAPLAAAGGALFITGGLMLYRHLSKDQQKSDDGRK